MGTIQTERLPTQHTLDNLFTVRPTEYFEPFFFSRRLLFYTWSLLTAAIVRENDRFTTWNNLRLGPRINRYY